MISALFIRLVLPLGALTAQNAPWQPAPGHTQVPIWPGAVPDARPRPGTETAARVSIRSHRKR